MIMADVSIIICLSSMDDQEDSFIGSKLKLIPSSRLLYSTPTQLLLIAKRQLIRLDSVHQTLAYAPIDDEKILHATYHSILAVYLLLSDKHIVAVNEAGEVIGKMVIESLVGVKFMFMVGLEDGYKGVPNNREDMLVYVKGDQLYSCQVSVFNQRQLIKNKSICDLNLTPHSPSLLQSPEFIQHHKHLTDISLLILWDNSQTYIYKTPLLVGQSLERLYIYSKISKRENQSLDYAVSMSLKLMAVAYESGVVKIFYLDHSKKYLADLKGHQAACTTIFVSHKTPELLYSCGLDNSLRVWNLRDYEQVYVLQLDLLSRQCRFITESLLFLRSDELKEKSYLCELNTNLLQPIVNDNLSGHLVRMRSDKDWCISIYSNNLVEFFSPIDHSLSNQRLEYPLQYGAILDVFALGSSRYAVTLQKGFSLIEFDKQEIKAQNFQLKKLVYNESIVRRKQANHNFIELIHEKLLGTFLFNVLSDWKNIPTAIVVTSLYFHQNSHLPFWEGTNHRKNETNNERTYCMIGTAKGEVLFVDIAYKSHYASKVQFHTDGVEFIRELRMQKDRRSVYFLSMSRDKQISIWCLSHNHPPTSLITLNHNKDMTYIEVFVNYVVVGEKDGEFSILKFQLQNGTEIQAQKASTSGGHLRAVICGDYMNYHQHDLFLTGGQDSVIKIWKGAEKDLLFQLKLFGIISTINFLHHRLNLIVCHNEQISVINQEKLKSLKKTERALLEGSPAKTQNLLQEITLRQFFYKQAASVVSPTRKKQFNRANTKYLHLTRKPTKLQDIDLTLLSADKQLQLQSNNKLMMVKPVSQPRLQSLDKKIKRFHLFTNNQAYEAEGADWQPTSTDSQFGLVLPRINTKAVISKLNNHRLIHNSQLLPSSRENRVKSFSTAARNKF